jgi:hypothetical protein
MLGIDNFWSGGYRNQGGQSVARIPMCTFQGFKTLVTFPIVWIILTKEVTSTNLKGLASVGAVGNFNCPISAILGPWRVLHVSYEI